MRFCIQFRVHVSLSFANCPVGALMSLISEICPLCVNDRRVFFFLAQNSAAGSVGGYPRSRISWHVLGDFLMRNSFRACLAFLSLQGFIQADPRDDVTASILAFLSRSLVLSFYEECTSRLSGDPGLLARTNATNWLLSRSSRINFLPHTRDSRRAKCPRI